MRLPRHLLSGVAAVALVCATAGVPHGRGRDPRPGAAGRRGDPTRRPRAESRAPRLRRKPRRPPPRQTRRRGADPAAAAPPAPAPPTAVAAPAGESRGRAEPVRAPAAASPADALPAEPIPVELAPKPKKKPRPAPPALETALSNDPTPTFSPQTLSATQRAEEHYAHIVAQGGWATDLPPLHAGSRGDAVAKLSRHLELEGDFGGARAVAQMGRHAHRGDQTLPGPHGPARDRQRLRRDAEGDQRFGRSATPGTRLERGAALQPAF